MTGTNETLGGGGFHHVSIKVQDIEASIRFYTEALGFVYKTEWGQGAKRTVLLDTGDGNYFEITGGRTDELAPNGHFAHIALRATDCDAVIAKVRAAGAEVTVEPKDVVLPSDPPLPIRIAFFKGPDGELIELFDNEAT
jgi:catechol 2,3-dioxygenase-like lactoylglutathione lyase family enzyme